MKKDLPTGIIHTTCIDLSYEGRGICKDNGQVIFVDGIFPGEEGDIEVSYRRAGPALWRTQEADQAFPRPD
jgi:tRNA/tmRNA/rRNA uracil-C5-methylase (TrmA/RlmC/RlmD family)